MISCVGLIIDYPERYTLYRLCNTPRDIQFTNKNINYAAYITSKWYGFFMLREIDGDVVDLIYYSAITADVLEMYCCKQQCKMQSCQIEMYYCKQQCKMQSHQIVMCLISVASEAHDALHSFSCKMLIANHPCMQCTYKESTLPR